MQYISVYRRTNDGKIVFVHLFEHIYLLFRTLYYSDKFESWSSSFNTRVKASKCDWDHHRRYIGPSDLAYDVDYQNHYAYVAFDEKDRVITPDRLLGMFRAYRNELHYDWWKRVYGNRTPGAKCKRHRGSYYRLIRTTNERRWTRAWDDEEDYHPRARRRHLPSAWDERPRMSHKRKNWKHYRSNQWKDQKGS